MIRRKWPWLIIILIVLVGITYLVWPRSDLVSSPSACVHQTLRQGTHGACVTSAQNLLNWALYGIDSPNYKTANGSFSATTVKEVNSFQTTVRLEPSSTINEVTWQQLCHATDPPSFWLSAARQAGCKV